MLSQSNISATANVTKGSDLIFIEVLESAWSRFAEVFKYPVIVYIIENICTFVLNIHINGSKHFS